MTIRTIDDGGQDSPPVVLGRLRTSYPEYFLIYGEFWSLLDKIASEHLSSFCARSQQDLVRIVQDATLDEYNQAEETAKLAMNYRYVGHLDGMLTLLIIAENFALYSRYSTLLIWCELATVFASIPCLEEAERCLENAADSLSKANFGNASILPGDTSGRWIAEMGVEFYQAQVDETKRVVRQVSRDPEFWPSRAMELVLVEDEALRQRFARDVAVWSDGFSSPDRVVPRLK